MGLKAIDAMRRRIEGKLAGDSLILIGIDINDEFLARSSITPMVMNWSDSKSANRTLSAKFVSY